MYPNTPALLSLLALLPSLIASTPLQKRSSGACAGVPNTIDATAASDYAVTMDQNDPGICQGFLVNLHGQCGLGITSWWCVASPTGQMNATFVVPTTCLGSSIQNAIWLASVPNIDGVGCSWPDPEKVSGAEAFAEVLEAIFHGAGELLP